jgi:hypothetical protein
MLSQDVVKVDMRDYMKNMIEDFPAKVGTTTAPTPATEHLFTIDSSPELDVK